ncbi:toll/interleukin-1 receptor domain-containing protein [Synechococcus sp. PCC 7336]|uniref:toll/interleukin-1 receptor domain-containing protein n=1 Tax=Synechococcus sp. PCC 7336 TaxID=195250 RepID=UPI0003761BCD|nr:toll/interleukin-1 receptor domain-containing protein [Synechococcus sp. PCC 7336]
MQVFISHSSKDTPIARKLTQRLSEAGLRVWMPENEILPGDNWAQKMGQALEESELMVVLISPHAFESEWLKEEIQYALTADQYKGRLIPIFLDPKSEISSDVPWILRKLNPIEWKGREEDWQQVIEKVRSLAE